MTEFRQPVLLSLIFLVFLLAFYNMPVATVIGLTYTVFIFILFVQRLGMSVPILELILLIACLQWVLGPFIAYSLGNSHYKYFMSLPEEYYMSFIVLCLFSLTLGLIIWSGFIKKLNDGRVKEAGYLKLDEKVAYFTMFLGLAAHSLTSFVPDAFRFVLFLIDGMQFISIFYFFHFRHKWRWIVLFSIVLINFGISITQGFFHNIIIWLVLIFIYLNLYYKMSLLYKLIIISAGLFFVYLLQSVKSEYRTTISVVNTNPLEERESKAEVFTQMMIDEAMEEEEADTSFLEVMNARLNQGWIISRVMTYVPIYEPFANGETVKNAVMASFVPRFFMKDKKKAGGKENFERFTGYTLIETSMGVSLVGEAYANFGYQGTFYFLFFWGLFLSTVYTFILYMTKIYPTFWLWIPLMFTQVIKAETDLVVVLNHLTKSLLLVLFLFWISRRFLNIRI